MKTTINCFLPFSRLEETVQTVKELRASTLVDKIYLLASPITNVCIPGCELISVEKMQSTQAMRAIAEHSDKTYTLLYTKHTALKIGMFALERMVQVMEMTQAGMVYADHYQQIDGVQKTAPVIDYQPGSLRDDFNFGSVLLFNANAFKEVIENTEEEYQYAGLYDLRLKISQKSKLVHINEYLYTEVESDKRKSGEKQFDYVDPKNRQVQIEMEQACTNHLKEIGGYLYPIFRPVDFSSHTFEYPEAQKFRIYISCFTSVAMDNLSRIATTDNRLLRRLTRDYTQRGADAVATLSRWGSVRRGEEKHIFPYQENADVMLNSSLFYEISVLRPYAEKILREVPDTVPEYDEARRMLKFLKNFTPIPPDEIPPTSIIREFIGGSSFKY